ncbi:MAG TPA: glycosyltransferase family 87 protein [Burkholderiales bacterium]|nr:glycosyltransferase family 87 protein [Burkholderiales bacterium]
MHTISRFTVWCLAAAALVAGLNARSPRMEANFYDGRFFYVAAQMFIAGEPPYDLERYRARLRDAAQRYPDSGAELRAEIESYAYPPASLIVFAPLGLLDYPLARQLFTVLNVLLMPIAALMLVLFFDGAGAARQRALTLAALVVGLLHFSFPTTLALGQCDIVMLVALAGTLLGLQRRSLALIAACGAVALIKPQLTLVPILALLVRERAWREGLILLATVALSNLLAAWLIYHPGLPREMLDAVISNRGLEYNQPATSHGGLFLGARSAAFAAANLFLIPAGVIAVLLAAWKRERYPKHTALVASILLALYALPLHYYDFVLLLAALLGCLTLDARLGALLIVLALGIDREVVTQAILSRLPSAPWLTHQSLHAAYVLMAYLAVQGYVFLRYARSTQTPPSAGGSAMASPSAVLRAGNPAAAQRSTTARGSAQVSE